MPTIRPSVRRLRSITSEWPTIQELVTYLNVRRDRGSPIKKQPEFTSQRDAGIITRIQFSHF